MRCIEIVDTMIERGYDSRLTLTWDVLKFVYVGYKVKELAD